MKKSILIATLAAFFVTLTSCKRDWVCVCSLGGFSAESEAYVDTFKKEAKDECRDLEGDLQNELGQGVSCEVEKD